MILTLIAIIAFSFGLGLGFLAGVRSAMAAFLCGKLDEALAERGYFKSGRK